MDGEADSPTPLSRIPALLPSHSSRSRIASWPANLEASKTTSPKTRPVEDEKDFDNQQTHRKITTSLKAEGCGQLVAIGSLTPMRPRQNHCAAWVDTEELCPQINHKPNNAMRQTLQHLVRYSATNWVANPVNHEQVERVIKAGCFECGAFFDPTYTSAFGPFERFYRLIEPDNFTREDATEFWGKFWFELPEDLEEQSDIVDEFCDAVLEAVQQ